MDLNLGQKRLVFVIVVIVLVGLGVYLIGNRHSGGSAAAAPTPSPSASTAQPSASAATAPYTPPSSLPAATPVSTAGGAEIYQWLPFTPAELTAAANTTVAFAKEYATWSYTENEAAYAARLRGLVTATGLAKLTYDYSTPGVAGQRVTDKQVSTGSGVIDSISSFAPAPVSITFLVTVNQQVTSTQPAAKTSGQYAVTVVSAGSAWQVNDIELSQLGNS